MRKKLKIITQGFYPDITATGELLYELARKLADKYAMEISVLTAQPGFVLKKNLPACENIHGIKVHRVFTSRFDKNSFVGKVLNSWIFFITAFFYSLFSKKPDYYLIPTSPPLAPLIGTVLKLLKGQKYIYLMHDIYPEIAWKLGYIKKKGIICRIWNKLTRLSLEYADKIVFLSEDMKDKTKKLFPELKELQLVIIPNWADESVIKPVNLEENYMLDKFNLRNKFIVEYSGNIGRVHEFRTFIQAANELKDDLSIIFLFIGDGGKKQELQGLVSEYRLDNVLFLPYQNRFELAYSLGMGNVHLLSLEEGYEHLSAPSKLYGILASGKPFVYAGNDNYISRLAQDSGCGYSIKKGEFEKLAKILKELKSFPEKQEQMGKNSREVFEKAFNLEKISNQYYEILNSAKNT